MGAVKLLSCNDSRRYLDVFNIQASECKKHKTISPDEYAFQVTLHVHYCP